MANFDGPLRHGPNGLAGHTIKNVEKSLLARLGHGLDGFPVDSDIRKNRRGGNVHVPQCMVHQLEVPFALAGFQIDADQGLPEQIVSRAVPTVKIAGRRLHRQVNQSELFVHRDLRPNPGVTGIFRGTLLPRVVAELALLRYGMENPEALAGSNVESANVSLIVAHALRGHAFAEGRADNYRVFSHDGRGLDADFACD